MPTAPSQRLALEWIRRNVRADGALLTSDRNPTPYPEVTGYTIPTLLRSGERNLASRLVRWLLGVQREDGSFLGADGMPHVFDTAQALRGFLAARHLVPEAMAAVERASNWLLQELIAHRGEWPRPASPAWVGVPPAVFLSAISPLAKALGVRGLLDRYRSTIDLAVRLYARQTRVRTNSHFLGYIVTGLIEVGRPRRAARVLRQTATFTWPGTAQLAEAHFLLGHIDAGAALLERMMENQRPSGGWTGGALSYFEQEEVSWAPKFYLDACAAYRRAWFDFHVATIPETIDSNDERVRVVLDAFGHLRGERFLDAGCGRGRYLHHVMPRLSVEEFHACDPSSELLQSLPAGVLGAVGELTNLPYPDAHFDGVICIEALEHAVFIEQALAELLRVTKPGGRIIIIDKDSAMWGRLETPPWEEWFPADLIGTSRSLAMERGLFRAWMYDRPS